MKSSSMCSDFKGGVLCLDAGCSAPWLDCAHLATRGLCHARWRHLSPFARTRAFVWQRCLSSCGCLRRGRGERKLHGHPPGLLDALDAGQRGEPGPLRYL